MFRAEGNPHTARQTGPRQVHQLGGGGVGQSTVKKQKVSANLIGHVNEQDLAGTRDIEVEVVPNTIAVSNSPVRVHQFSVCPIENKSKPRLAQSSY